jgi:hypothetical protein
MVDPRSTGGNSPKPAPNEDSGSMLGPMSFELGLSQQVSDDTAAAAVAGAKDAEQAGHEPEFGYDILVRIIQCTGLPGHDW